MTYSTPDTCIFWSCSIKIIVYCSCLKHDFKCFPIYHRRTSTQKSFTPRTSQIPQPASSTTKCQFAATSRAHKHVARKSQVPTIVNWIVWIQEHVFDQLVTSLCENQWSWKKLVMTDILTTFMRDSYSMRQKCWIKLWLIGQMFGGGFRTL